MEGIVSKYQWKNPHLYFYVDETNESGETVTWRVEAGPLAIMRRLGWTKESLAEGDAIVVTANPGRNPEKHSAFLRKVESADKDLTAFASEDAFQLLSANSAPSVEKAQSLSGTWVTLLDIDVAGPIDDPEKLSLTEAGTHAIESFDEQTMHTGLDCIPMTAPAFMLIPDTKSIEIGEGVAWIRGEFDSSERLVYLDSSTVADDERSIQGHSIGRWDGDVLKVETTRFVEHRMGNAFSLPSGLQKHLTEEFELNPDGVTLTYRFAVEDPEFLAEPFTGAVQWAYRPDIEYSPLECDRENSRLFLED